jgi:aminoglycoside phosphotransferase (APT) family kinase protein
VVDLVPLASGRSADVFAIDERRVLRRYRDGGDATAEASLMSYVAGLGFPVPRVYEATGADLVIERLHGPSMVRALAGGELGIEAAADILADLHDRLHRLPARSGPRPDLAILHLDLHPDNVILTPGAAVVIDWRNAAEGPPDLDLAMSALIMAQVAVGGEHHLAAAARTLTAAFLRCAGGDPVRMLDRAVAIRRADPGLTAAEIAQLDSAAALVVNSRGESA